jgi:hypothetical protein
MSLDFLLQNVCQKYITFNMYKKITKQLNHNFESNVLGYCPISINLAWVRGFAHLHLDLLFDVNC